MFCTGKEQLTCNSEKLGCEGCYYFNDENEDIENVKFIIGDLKADNYNQTLVKSLENVITEIKELKNKYQHEKVLNSELEELLENSISKSEVIELIQRLEHFKNDKNISKQRKEDMEAEIVDLKMLLQEGDK